MHTLLNQWFSCLIQYVRLSLFRSSPASLPYSLNCILLSFLAYLVARILLLHELQSLSLIVLQAVLDMLLLFAISYIMLKYTLTLLLAMLFTLAIAQDISDSPWHIPATDIDPNNYYGITVANGVVGLVSSPEPMKVQDVVLNGVYDYYQRGRVSNILKTFNHMNLDLDYIDMNRQ